MGLYAGVDYNLTLCPLQSRLQHIYHGQPFAGVDLNPKPESTLSSSQGLRIWPLYLPIFENIELTWKTKRPLEKWQIEGFHGSHVTIPTVLSFRCCYIM
jgi:hypothetical protein